MMKWNATHIPIYGWEELSFVTSTEEMEKWEEDEAPEEERATFFSARKEETLKQFGTGFVWYRPLLLTYN
jgi:hypothetical protein